MSNIDEQFVEYIVKSLVGNPDGVVIDRTIDEKGVLLKLSVDQEDLGRVIGKRGATAQSIRTLLRALGTKNDARYNLKIVDTGDGAPAPSDDTSSSNDSASDESPAAAEESQEAVEEMAPESEAEVETVESEPQEAVEEEEESLAERTRKELDDLDDLEI